MFRWLARLFPKVAPTAAEVTVALGGQFGQALDKEMRGIAVGIAKEAKLAAAKAAVAAIDKHCAGFENAVWTNQLLDREMLDGLSYQRIVGRYNNDSAWATPLSYSCYSVDLPELETRLMALLYARAATRVAEDAKQM